MPLLKFLVCTSTSRSHPLFEQAPDGALYFRVEAAKDGFLLGSVFIPVLLSVVLSLSLSLSRSLSPDLCLPELHTLRFEYDRGIREVTAQPAE